MKKTAIRPKQTINLAQYRETERQSMHKDTFRESLREPNKSPHRQSIQQSTHYKPQLVYAMLGNNRPEFSSISSERHQHAVEKMQDSLQLDSQLNRLKIEVDDQRRKYAQIRLESMNKMEQMKRKLEDMRSSNDQLTRQNKEMGDRFMEMKEKITDMREQMIELQQERDALKSQNEQLQAASSNLKKKITTLQGNLKSLKENHESATPVKPIEKVNTREVYEHVEKYLKSRVEEFTKELKQHRMSQRLEEVIENFLEEILHLNHMSVVNHHRTVRTPIVEIPQQRQDYLSLVNVERLKLDKSLEKLRMVHRKEDWTNDEARRRSVSPIRAEGDRAALNGNLSMLTNENRSRSRRKRIFD